DLERVAALNPQEAKRAARQAVRAAKALGRRSTVDRSSTQETRYQEPTAWQRLKKPGVLVPALGLALLLVAIATARERIPGLRTSFFGAELDSTRIALVPFGGSASRADRDRIASRVYAAITEWRGLNIASDQDVNEAASRSAPRSTHAAADLAKSVGAGAFIWGQMNADDPSQVRIELFDVSSNVPRKSISLRATADSSAVRAAVRELLKIPNRPPTADGGDGRTTSYPAWSAF